VCVCACVCARACVSGYAFPQFSTHLLQILREHYIGLARCMGYICFVCTQCAHVRAKSARMCTFAYFVTDSLQICWEHTTTHHKWQGLRTFHVLAHACERACASARVVKRSLIFRWILFKYAVIIQQFTTSSMTNLLFMFTHRAHACMNRFSSNLL
jgi:hypothetical protein